MSIGKMFLEMGPVGWAVMLCLLGLSVYSIGLMVDKTRRFRTARRESKLFLEQFAEHMEKGKVRDAIMTSHQYPNAPVAAMVQAEVWEYQEAGKSVQDGEVLLGLVERAGERVADRSLATMRKGLGNLATIGSMAPFIGLFGTIVGIIHAFQGIASTGSGGIAAVSGGIAEALVATALGILVAIPAVMGFNQFTVTLETTEMEMHTVSAQFVDHLRKSSSTQKMQSRPVHAAQ